MRFYRYIHRTNIVFFDGRKEHSFAASIPGASGVRGGKLVLQLISIYMYEQDGVGWAEIREVL